MNASSTNHQKHSGQCTLHSDCESQSTSSNLWHVLFLHRASSWCNNKSVRIGLQNIDGQNATIISIGRASTK